MTNVQTVRFEQADQGEEAARAALYGLLSNLFYAPPSQALLDDMAASAVDGDGPLQQAWRELAAACKGAQELEVRDEYETLFIGVGKPEVMLYGSYYLSGFLMEKPLAELRADLARLGIERADKVTESEDHLATLCAVMRYLIESDDGTQASLQAQQAFFAAHMQKWVGECCNAVASHPQARLYRAAAGVARQFFEVETQAFDML
ncbi:MAG TPA: molecular chaperone TorD family protein [Oxalicibacterium sp.]|jgi:TorA maturation chaperone TorD|nr:molecular chaperone TorD family protein [Oxalicibacterium sp.]